MTSFPLLREGDHAMTSQQNCHANAYNFLSMNFRLYQEPEIKNGKNRFRSIFTHVTFRLYILGVFSYMQII